MANLHLGRDFTPPDTGKYNATLSVTDTDKSSPQTASLSGTGLNN